VIDQHKYNELRIKEGNLVSQVISTVCPGISLVH